MRRRKFLATVGGSVAALKVVPGLSVNSRAADGTDLSLPALLPGDLDTYFTEEKLRDAIDTTASLKGVQFEVVANYFAAWHSSPALDKIYGKGWTLWERVKKSKPLFPGQLLPKYPLWGYFNDADPAWAEREIDTAARYGIGVWAIDWYWHSGTMFYQEQLEQGFLKAANRSKLKFGIMWANEDWAGKALPQVHSVEDCVRATDYIIEHYFSQPNYWRIDGKLVLGIYQINLIQERMSLDGWKRAADLMRERVAKSGLGELHLQASGYYNGLDSQLRSLRFDSARHYHPISWSYHDAPKGKRSTYGEMATASVQVWKDSAAKCDVPYFPTCQTGDDVSPNMGAKAHIVTQRSPDQFERLLRAGQYFSVASSERPKIIFLSAWNEWMEDRILLPDTYYGYSYLEAVGRCFKGHVKSGA